MNVADRLTTVEAGLRRFADEGKLRWSADELQKLLGAGISIETPEVRLRFREWCDCGFVSIVGSGASAVLMVVDPNASAHTG